MSKSLDTQKSDTPPGKNKLAIKSSKKSMEFSLVQIGENKNSQINAVLLNSIIGFAFSISPLLSVSSKIPLTLILINDWTPTRGILSLISAVSFSVILISPINYIQTSIIGWIFGGIVSGFIFGKEGKHSPILALKVWFRVMYPLSFVIFISLLMLGGSGLFYGDDLFALTIVAMIVVVMVQSALSMLGSVGYWIGRQLSG